MKEKILIIKKLSKKFDNHYVVKNVSLEIEKGKIVGIIGRNGSGKTVFLKMIIGLYIPTSGDIDYCGYNVIDDYGVLVDTGFLENETGFTNLKLLAILKNKINDQKIYEIMKMVKLDPDSKIKYKNYSTGMKQKLKLAQALMEESKILILDEPFNGMDKESVTFFRNYYDLIKELKANDRRLFLEAIVYYVFEDKEPNFNGLHKAIWQMIQVPLDSSKNKSKNAKKTKSNKNQNEIKLKSKEIDRVGVDTISISPSTSISINNIKNNNLYEFIEVNFGRTLNGIEYEKISTWEDTELTRYAIKQAVLNNKFSINYIEKILSSYKKENVRNVKEAQRREEKFQEEKNGRKTITPNWLNKEFKEEGKNLSDEDKRIIESLKGGNTK